MNKYHTPVLLEESVGALVQNPGGTYIDATFGGGGHARDILARLSGKGRLIAFDQDQQAHENKLKDERLTLVHQNFRFLKNTLRLYGVKEVQGVLVDLGVSSHQFDASERGFSTRFEGDLDMRMNQSAGKSAQTVVNTYEEQALATIFFQYGELKNARKIARKIVCARALEPIKTTQELKALVASEVPAFKINQYLAQVFQALRIEVNDELNALKELMEQAAAVLAPEGRLVVISYHSLEDRLVKRFIKNGQFEGEAQKDMFGRADTPLKEFVRGIIKPSEAEIAENNRARSAKLRVAIKR